MVCEHGLSESIWLIVHLGRPQMANPNRDGYSRKGRSELDFRPNKNWVQRRRDDEHKDAAHGGHGLRMPLPGMISVDQLAVDQRLATGLPSPTSSNDTPHDQPRRGASAPPPSRRPSPVPELSRACDLVIGNLHSTEEPALDPSCSDNHQSKPKPAP
jgi:hypothetical protein